MGSAKIIRTASCCLVNDSCAQLYAYKCEQLLYSFILLGLDLVFVFCGLYFRRI